jgi:hypothetical protein
MINSQIREGGFVPFPAHTGERAYMVPFTQGSGLPVSLRRWQPTVDAMLLGITAPGSIYIMIDQGVIEPGGSHRRPGPHVDGNWIAELGMHGHRHPGLHDHGDYLPEAIVLASTVGEACRAILGRFDGVPMPDGNCEHVDMDHGAHILFQANRAYVGNVTMVHESLLVPSKVARSLVRLNIPGATLH